MTKRATKRRSDAASLASHSTAVARGGVYLLVGLAFGCQSAPGPIFPEVSPARVWPPPPDTPRIQYVGALVGEASLDKRPQGWDAFVAVLAGPPTQVAFSRPTAVATLGSRVYVADAGLGVVHMLDLETREYAAWLGAAGDPFAVPIDIAIIDGDVWVVDRKRAAIDVFSDDGAHQRTLRCDEIAAPTAIAFDVAAERVWIADVAAHACFALSRAGEIVDRLEGADDGGRFNFPGAMAYHADVGLVVVDAMNFCVRVFPPHGGPTTTFGQEGDAAGDFARPRGVACDSAGRIYVLDNRFENVQIFTADGRLLMALGRGGADIGEFNLPSDIWIDERDRIWIADSYNRRVQVFDFLAEQP